MNKQHNDIFFATIFLQCSSCDIQSNSKRPDLDAIFKYAVKISDANITFADIDGQVESLIK